MNSNAKSVSVVHSGSFSVDQPPEKAIYLFTAPGEELWVPGWAPTLLHGDGFEKGTVFKTGHDDEHTIWVVVDFDTKTCRARYARITPASRAGTVEVNLVPNAESGSTVNVKYQLCALTPDGNEHLAGFDENAYSEMLAEWKTLLEKTDVDLETLIPHRR